MRIPIILAAATVLQPSPRLSEILYARPDNAGDLTCIGRGGLVGAILPTAPGMISSSPSATPLLPCSSVQPKNESLPPYRFAGLIVALPTSILTNGTRSASRSLHRLRSALDRGSLAI
jgi:hypothetical protein